MNIALWVVAGLLGLVFLLAGITKLSQPRSRLARMMGWVEDFGDGQVKGIAVLEILAAAGLILPAAFHIAPVLTPIAAIGLVLLMIGAARTHFRRGEAPMIAGNLVLLALAAFVAWGRLGPYPF